MMDEAREACPSPPRVGVAFLAPLPYVHAGARRSRASRLLTRASLPPAQVTDVFTVKDYAKALEKMRSRTAVKIAVKP